MYLGMFPVDLPLFYDSNLRSAKSGIYEQRPISNLYDLISDNRDIRPEGGESRTDLFERTKKFVDDVLLPKFDDLSI